MALVSAGTPILYPMPPSTYTATVSITTQAINTIGHGVACIFQPGIDDTITHVYFRSGAVNAGTIDIRIETVDPATGLPSGTLWAANTSASRVMLASDDNAYFEVALTSGAVVNKEDWVAIVVQAATSTVGTVGYGFAGPSISFGPYHATNAGSWAANATVNMGIITPKFSNAGYAYIDFFCPANGTATRTFNNTSTPDVRGNKITVPYKCRVSGCHVQADFDGDCIIKMFSSDGATLLASVSVDAKIRATTAAARMNIIFDTAVDLDAGDVVYLVVEPSTGTSLSVYDMTFLNSDLKGVYCANAVSVSAKDPTSSSDYTEAALEINMIGLLISHIDDGSGITPIAGLHPIEQGIST